MATWRMAGLNYVNYSNIAARTLRQALKGKERDDAMKRDSTTVSIFFWMDGNILPKGQKPPRDAAQVQQQAAAAQG